MRNTSPPSFPSGRWVLEDGGILQLFRITVRPHPSPAFGRALVSQAHLRSALGQSQPSGPPGKFPLSSKFVRSTRGRSPSAERLERGECDRGTRVGCHLVFTKLKSRTCLVAAALCHRHHGAQQKRRPQSQTWARFWGWGGKRSHSPHLTGWSPS